MIRLHHGSLSVHEERVVLERVILGFGVIVLISAWPLSKLIEQYTDRLDEEDWRKVQEEAKTKPVLVGQLRDLLNR